MQWIQQHIWIFWFTTESVKKPVLAIEVDGYEFHKKDTVQASRDLLKDRIMDLYEIPLLRFKTNGSSEREKIAGMLDKLVG